MNVLHAYYAANFSFGNKRWLLPFCWVSREFGKDLNPPHPPGSFFSTVNSLLAKLRLQR